MTKLKGLGSPWALLMLGLAAMEPARGCQSLG